ncbi:MAG: D-hexose-6-phosphate mutarotase [Spirochaetales bacterium]
MTLHHADDLATFTLQGAHLTSWQPAGHEPVLWMSSSTRWETGEVLRGGVPVCWPWFGAHPDGGARHGFVRTLVWTLLGVTERPEHLTVSFGLDVNGTEDPRWPYRARVEFQAEFGADLTLRLLTRNTDGRPFTFTEALHTYFQVGDIGRVEVAGPEGEVRFSGEVDQVFEGTTASCVIRDPSLGRQLRIDKSGSASTVIWNPGEARARLLGDLGDELHRNFVCVESGNVRGDAVTLAPGATHTLAVVYTVARL